MSASSANTENGNTISIDRVSSLPINFITVSSYTVHSCASRHAQIFAHKAASEAQAFAVEYPRYADSPQLRSKTLATGRILTGGIMEKITLRKCEDFRSTLAETHASDAGNVCFLNRLASSSVSAYPSSRRPKGGVEPAFI